MMFTALFGLALAGCALHLPPPQVAAQHDRCVLPVVKLSANRFDDANHNAETGFGRPERQTLTLAAMVAEARPTLANTNRKAVLVLSGGSQHGAFGAGLFYGWAGDDPAAHLPDYAVVTGISTGALQSTWVFLARQTYAPDPARFAGAGYLSQRLGHAFAGIAPPGTTWLGDLAQDYMPAREDDLLTKLGAARFDTGTIGYLSLIDHTSLATFAPLRATLLREIDAATIRAIAAEADRGRKLFVGIADLVNGYGYAADLTRLAQLAAHPDGDNAADAALVFPGHTGADDAIDAARQCYVDALIASSSVPPGVPPVSIAIIKERRATPDNPATLDPVRDLGEEAQHAFVDGGVAYAVFISQLYPGHDAALGPIDLDLVVNGAYYPSMWDKYETYAHRSHRIADVKVSAVDIGLQTVELLQDQVRYFSVEAVRNWAEGHGRLRWAFISDARLHPGANGLDQLSGLGEDPNRHSFTDPDGGTKTCGAWRDADSRTHPVEFDVHYMRCLLAYGVTRGRDPAQRWNLCAAAPGAPCDAP